MSFSRHFTGVAFSLLVMAMGIVVLSASASGDDCITPDGAEFAICDDIMEHWQGNGAEDTFGVPVTEEAIEIDPGTGDEIIVQYFERARLEFHPELANTGYAVQSGRLGAELLHARGIEWRDLSTGAESGDVFEATGQAIAPEFEAYWREHGIDLDDDAGAFRESLALHGYPVSPPETVDDNDEILLIQWFERARLELMSDGSVEAAPVGIEAIESEDRLSVRAEREITTLLQEISEEDNTPGLGVWMESPVVGDFQWSIGEANPETGQPYTSETHHRIGSVTKPFVGEVILQLADDGMIDLDDTVEEWFPELEGAGNITIRMLGNMTSDIFNYTDALAWVSELMDDPEELREPEDMLRYGFDLTEDTDPGDEWAYSNTNYIMLGLIIEDVTGNDLADELESRIFEPLGMENTAFDDPNDPALPEPYARATTFMGLGSSGQDATNWNPSWAWAAGQIYSTPADMIHWLPDVYQGSQLSEDMRAERLDLVDMRPAEPQDEIAAGDDAPDDELSYGFGVLWSNGWYGHDGLITGYASMVAYHPELDASLVVFGNSDEIGPDGTLAIGLAFQRITSILEREFPDLHDD